MNIPLVATALRLLKEDVNLARRTSDGFIGHARGCKKSPDDCKQCKAAITYHASLPLDVLALVLEDRPTLKS